MLDEIATVDLDLAKILFKVFYYKSGILPLLLFITCSAGDFADDFTFDDPALSSFFVITTKPRFPFKSQPPVCAIGAVRGKSLGAVTRSAWSWLTQFVMGRYVDLARPIDVVIGVTSYSDDELIMSWRGAMSYVVLSCW